MESCNSVFEEETKICQCCRPILFGKNKELLLIFVQELQQQLISSSNNTYNNNNIICRQGQQPMIATLRIHNSATKPQ